MCMLLYDTKSFIKKLKHILKTALNLKKIIYIYRYIPKVATLKIVLLLFPRKSSAGTGALEQTDHIAQADHRAAISSGYLKNIRTRDA